MTPRTPAPGKPREPAGKPDKAAAAGERGSSTRAFEARRPGTRDHGPGGSAARDPGTRDSATSDAAAGRSLRADARRNRAKVLDVAHEVFAAEGLEVPVDEIARRAEVGIGTVYRHFPTKEALFEAVVLHNLQRLAGEARALAAAEDAGGAFFGFFSRMVEQALVHKALFDALAAGGRSDLPAVAAGAKRDLTAALGELLARAQRAGEVRADVDVADVNALIIGCIAMERQRADAGREGSTGRAVAVVRDGLRA